MLRGGAILKVSACVRGRDLELLWSHVVYELGERYTDLEMWEMSTGVITVEIGYSVSASTRCSYDKAIEDGRLFFLGRLNDILEQAVSVIDFLKYSPIPRGRKRIGLMRQKQCP